jgi:hypothetical protein
MPQADRQSHVIGVRPEDLILDPLGALEAHVTDIAFQGNAHSSACERKPG